jgi:branched-chain amino acid transport system ATP-binding protein
MGQPHLLLCDEPSLGLAPRLVREMLNTLAKLRERGITVLVADQNALAVLQMADRGYVLDSGRIVAEGASQDLLNDRRLRATYLGGGLSKKA